MQTKLIKLYEDQALGKEAEAILRSCVHCGFCNATCPTYQVLGNELDGPRGRIYLIKQMLEGKEVSEKTLLHLDRCLTCRACETTCPSGVEYHRLLDIGRELIADRVSRPLRDRWARVMLARLLSNKKLFGLLLRVGQVLRPILPMTLRTRVPLSAPVRSIDTMHRPLARKVLLLEGCVQDALAPNINAATRTVFAAFGVECVSEKKAACCGAVNFHLDEIERAKEQVRANVDAWWPRVEQQEIEAIIVNASGCGVFAKEYQTLLKDDAVYLQKAMQISALVQDPVELLLKEDWTSFMSSSGLGHRKAGKIAFHPPCTLQHGQKITGKVESILQGLGVDLVPFADTHLCCGSAGTYSIFQTELSAELKARKLNTIRDSGAVQIVTANIGCQSHLASGSGVPVRHWLELVADIFSEEVLTKARSE